MKTKKGKKMQESSSSSSSSSSEDESSSRNSSVSSDYEKTHKAKKRKSSKEETSQLESKQSTSLDGRDEKASAERKKIEHSKWDSPIIKGNKKRKSERGNNSQDRETRNEKIDGSIEQRRGKNGERKRNEKRYSRDRSNSHGFDRRGHDEIRHRYNEHDRSEGDGREKLTSRGQRFQRNNDGRSRNSSRDRRNKSGQRRRRSRSGSFDHSKASWGRNQQQNDKKNSNEKEKEKPNFGLSGKLTEETNTYRGVVIKYSEPPEARKPKRRWRLYPFKGEKAMQTLYIHRESAYLIGRDRKIVDIPVDHPSCSKQHAALQYRLVPFTRDDGSSGKRIRPYLIDLDSANGTYINNKKIDPKKYIELLERDVIKFGYSSREYVLLHENSKNEGMDDDVKLEETAVKEELD